MNYSDLFKQRVISILPHYRVYKGSIIRSLKIEKVSVNKHIVPTHY